MQNNSSSEGKSLSRRNSEAKRTVTKSLGNPASDCAASSKRKRANVIRFTTDDFIWQCWQCLSAFSNNVDLEDHLQDCHSRNAAEGAIILPMEDSLPGCPFCPRDGCQAASKPYYFHDFDEHVKSQHPEVKELTCPYCTNKISSLHLKDLTSHILLDHQVHWRPSPASMVYQRTNDVAHRVVTCLGCGWCTFVLRAQDAVQPPASLASHMSRCTGRGARLSVPHLPPALHRPTQVPTRALVSALTAASTSASQAFAARFPGVRGYVASASEATTTGISAQGDEVPQKRLRYRSPLKRITPVSPVVAMPLAEIKLKSAQELRKPEDKLTNGNEPTESPRSTINLNISAEVETASITKSPQEEQQQMDATSTADSPQEEQQQMVATSTMESPQAKQIGKENMDRTAMMECEDEQSLQSTLSQELHKPTAVAATPKVALLRKQMVSKGVFDVPLDLPPSPPPTSITVADVQKPTPSRVYVCPICGDNALTSLRERDKHLQAMHAGELVFPCQLCGMAYPVYIALRRHAVLKHAANFDAVLYGQPDKDPVDCPYCELVAFTSPEVLQLHLVKIHPDQLERQTVVHAVASALAAPDSESDPEAVDDDDDDRDWVEENGIKGDSMASASAAATATRFDEAPVVRRGRGRGGRRGRSKSLGAPVYTSSDLLNDPDILESVENFLQMRQPFTPGRRGRGRGRGRGSSSSTSIARGRGTGRPRGRPRGSTRALGIYGSASTATTTNLNQSMTTASQQQLESGTILIDLAGRPVEGIGLATAGGMNKIEIPSPPNAVNPLEVALAEASPVHAPVACRLCGSHAPIVLDNAKELCVHMELDHNPESTCEQLGCQACGRIFFGPHHRSDLIGHIRVVHQAQEEAMICRNHARGCGAKFTSSRLRDSHLLVPNTVDWSCPLDLASESFQAVTEVANAVASTTESLDTMVLATEIAADAAGQMVLAYGCPLCSRVFVGQSCTARYLTHQSQCGAITMAVEADETVSVEQPNSVTMMTLTEDNADVL